MQSYLEAPAGLLVAVCAKKLARHASGPLQPSCTSPQSDLAACLRADLNHQPSDDGALRHPAQTQHHVRTPHPHTAFARLNEAGEQKQPGGRVANPNTNPGWLSACRFLLFEGPLAGQNPLVANSYSPTDVQQVSYPASPLLGKPAELCTVLEKCERPHLQATSCGHPCALKSSSCGAGAPGYRGPQRLLCHVGHRLQHRAPQTNLLWPSRVLLPAITHPSFVKKNQHIFCYLYVSRP